MRSCFVPNCDILCKNMTKRMMFIPPKNQEMLTIWKCVLPNRRELKPTDRVCERHFQSTDICKTFDHIINGVLHQIDRGKPKLRETAIPSYNLPKTNEEMRDLKRKHNGEIVRKSKKHVEISEKKAKLINADGISKTRRPIIKRLLKNLPDKQSNEGIATSHITIEHYESIDDGLLLNEIAISHDQDNAIETVLPSDEEPEDSTFIEKYDDRNSQATLEELDVECFDTTLFEGLYEDVYEVILPNTLWGIHRDPNRTFIVFSYFDDKTCSTSKLIRLDNRMNTQIYFKGKLFNKCISNWSIEYLTNFVSQVDEYRICEQFDLNGTCDGIAVDEKLCSKCQ